MSSESTPGKKDPASQPIVPAMTSRSGLSGAIQAVANAPIQNYTYNSGGRSNV